jgi:plastocyanin
MKKWLALMFVCLTLGLVVAGCGSDDDGGGGDAVNTEQPSESGSAGGDGGADGPTVDEGSAGGAAVGMKNIQFQPGDISVGAGETITFTNDEAIPHDVKKTGGPGGDFQSGPEGGMSEGDTFKLTLDRAGTYEYVCRVHAPGMAGTITVK